MWLSYSQLSAASVPELIGFLANTHHLVRAQAARELVNRKEQPKVAWQALVAVQTDDSWMVRLQVVRGAVHLAAPPAEAIPVLRHLLADADEVIQSYAAWALESFGQGSQKDLLDELPRQRRCKRTKPGQPGK
jgi:HEAT repeat protein